MRILVLSSMLPRREGSGAIPVLLFAELLGLSERHELTLVAPMGDEPGEAEAAAELEDAGFDLDLHVVDRRRPAPGGGRRRRQRELARSWLRSGWPWRTVWFAAPGIQTVLDRLAAEREFDVVAIEDSAMTVFDLPAGVPAVLTANEVLRPRRVDWRAGPPQEWPRWALREIDWRRWPRFQRNAWRRFDRLQVFSERDAGRIAELAPELASRVRVNPFGVVMPPAADPDRVVPGTLLFLGHFAHPPNRDAAIWLAREIMPAVLERQPDARLRIVGTAAPREVLELAGPRVEVVPDAPSIEPHLEQAAVVLAPVRTGGGMRMKVLQALASGKAVVTTPRGTEGYTGFGVEPPLVVADDAAGLAEETASLLTDAPRRRELGERAREFALRHHSPQAWAERLEGVYEDARRGRLEAAPHG
jgi:glycosyltransferase involved in cell wall biosynthesis